MGEFCGSIGGVANVPADYGVERGEESVAMRAQGKQRKGEEGGERARKEREGEETRGMAYDAT
jgi:hypothetical protein